MDWAKRRSLETSPVSPVRVAGAPALRACPPVSQGGLSQGVRGRGRDGGSGPDPAALGILSGGRSLRAPATCRLRELVLNLVRILQEATGSLRAPAPSPRPSSRPPVSQDNIYNQTMSKPVSDFAPIASLLACVSFTSFDPHFRAVCMGKRRLA